MLFFGSRCERLCMTQFALISLIPGLIRNLQDCADPELNNYEHNLVKPTTLKTSERTSCRQYLTEDCKGVALTPIVLSFMGLPLQIFGKVGVLVPTTHSPRLIQNHRAASSVLTRLCSSLIFSPTTARSHILSVPRTLFCYNKRTGTAIF